MSMTADELRADTAEYDAENVDPLAMAKPFPRRDKARHEKRLAAIRAQMAKGEPVGNATPQMQARAAKAAELVNKGGRPVVGQGAERVMVSIDW